MDKLKLAPGDKVFVVRSMNDMRRRSDAGRYIPAVVKSAARVWVTLTSDEGGWPFVWRMRLDTQDDGGNYPGSSYRFVTAEQKDREEATSAARKLLREQGIIVEYSSPWRGKEAKLAELLRGVLDAPA